MTKRSLTSGIDMPKEKGLVRAGSPKSRLSELSQLPTPARRAKPRLSKAERPKERPKEH